jgi:hypothetical protein
MARFKFSEVQAAYILDTPLRRLTTDCESGAAGRGLVPEAGDPAAAV